MATWTVSTYHKKNVQEVETYLQQDGEGKVESVTPEEFMGEVIGDLNSKRAQIEEMGDRAMVKFIKAKVPLSEMFGYATALRSMTQGQASYTMEFDHYTAVPNNIAQKIIESRAGINVRKGM